MKFARQFDDFLRKTVNLNQSRLDDLDGHAKALESVLSAHEGIDHLCKGTIPQGSWAHQTIIKPLPNREFDADFLLQLDAQADWAPSDYIDVVHEALCSNENYKSRAEKKCRCVRVRYAGQCHVDIVPFVRSEDVGSGHIVNGVEDKFEATNPEGLTAWFDEQNQAAGGQLRRAVRLAKYLRDIKGTFTAKSVILTTLMAKCVDRVDPDGFPDTPTAVKTLFAALADYLELFPDQPPSVSDPSNPTENLNHRWPEKPEVYVNFRKMIRSYADRISKAWESGDRLESMAGWRDIFGDQFGTEIQKEGAMESRKSDVLAPGEQSISDLGVIVPDSFPHRVTVQCVASPAKGFRGGDIRALGALRPGRSLTFSVSTCSASPPYNVYWKIRNTGPDATNNLRGDIHMSPTREEHTRYRGHHWVECYIVQNGVCVAKNRVPVRVR